MTDLYADVGSDLAVVGRNPENADYTNPRGDIIREVYYVSVQNAYGNRWIHTHGFGRDEAAAKRFCDRVNGHLKKGGDLNYTHWRSVEPLYGSDAYAANWQEYEGNEIAREREEESWGGRGWWG